MPRLAIRLVPGLLMLAGCVDPSPRASATDMHGWRYVTGKTPSSAEYAAFVATCQGSVVQRLQGKPLDACLADFGLKRAE